MKNKVFILFALALGLFALSAQAESHRATHLGNSATRFAPPLHTPGDLRARFADSQLHPDIAAILRQWGWSGNLADLFAAAASAEISEIEIPVGETMPFMSSRENGKPICLRHVTWAGQKPISAYVFNFTSNGRRYRCVTPKPCSNFYLEDLGAEPKSGLAIDCNVPDKEFVGHKIPVCLNVHNLGNIPEPLATVTLPVPAGVVVTATTDGGVVVNNSVTWQIADFPPATTKQVCVIFKAQKRGTLAFTSTISSASVPAMQSTCQTAIAGVPAILLEKADDPDPVGVGDTTTYTVKITNQGTADDFNVQVVVTIAPELAPVSASEGKIDGQTVTLPVVSVLMPKHVVTYQIVAKGVTPGDGHTKFVLTSDALQSPVNAEESTTVY